MKKWWISSSRSWKKLVKDFIAARRYAQALFEIARDLHQDETIEAELESLSEALKSSPAIERSLANPALKTGEKRKFLQRIYQESPPRAGLPRAERSDIYEVLLNFLTVLFEKNRFHLIHDIAVDFKRIADEAQGQGVAEIRSAAALKPEAQRQIVHRLEKLAGYKITVKSVVDPSLIGGVSVKVRNKVIDDTVKNKIGLLKKELTKIQSI
jgi:F-type H+-transporting ATPase subunit delta